MRSLLAVLLAVVLVACAAAKRSPEAGIAETPEAVPSPPEPTGPRASVDPDAGCLAAPDLPCDVVRRGRLHHRFPTAAEAEEMEALLATMPEEAPAVRRLLARRIAAAYLEIACLAYRECVREEVSTLDGGAHRRAVAGTIGAEVARRFRRSCERLASAPVGERAPCPVEDAGTGPG